MSKTDDHKGTSTVVIFSDVSRHTELYKWCQSTSLEEEI